MCALNGLKGKKLIMNRLSMFIKKYHYIIMSTILIILNILLFIFVQNLNVLTVKYCSLLFGGLFLLEILSIVFTLIKKKVMIIIGYVLAILLIILNICGIYYVRVTDNFLDKAFDNDKREYTNTFYVISLKDSNYTLDNIVDSNLGYYKDTPNISQAIKEVNDKYKIHAISYEDTTDMFHKIGTEIHYILIEKNLYTYILEAEKELNKDNYTIIYEYTLTFEEKVENNMDNNVNNSSINQMETDNINIYIGGTDFTNQLYDFNMIVSINKDSHKVLLTSIPRDYHIPVYGKGGRKDNMGYHGAWGITTSMKSLEQLLGIKVDYYVKVRTNSLVGVVDTLGGIPFCSDKSFYTTHATILDSYDDSKGNKLYVTKGCRNYNGVEILTISRERLAYSDGDKQRQKNCQNIMISIFNKAISPNIITNYQSLLTSISDLYTTNIPRDIITDYIRDILNNNTKWTINTQSLEGYDSRGYVHLTNYMDYVMMPSQDSINNVSYNIRHN